MNNVEITTPDGILRVALHGSTLTVGRGASNDVALPYSHISRNHAELRFRQGAWWVIDQGSTNGLHVGGQRVLEARLDPSVTVDLSPQVALRLLAEAEAAPPPAPASAPQPPLDITPLSAYAPRSPYAEDETPYYPQMRPAPPASQPRSAPPPAPSQPAPPNHRASAPPVASAPIVSTAPLAPQWTTSSGTSSTTLHICQTCGQRTAPDAVYCQSCHHSIATECPNCRLSLLPIQTICPRCQTPNPGAVKQRKQRSH